MQGLICLLSSIILLISLAIAFADLQLELFELLELRKED
jgi:hypothetical protein